MVSKRLKGYKAGGNIPETRRGNSHEEEKEYCLWCSGSSTKLAACSQDLGGDLRTTSPCFQPYCHNFYITDVPVSCVAAYIIEEDLNFYQHKYGITSHHLGLDQQKICQADYIPLRHSHWIYDPDTLFWVDPNPQIDNDFSIQ
ncbi:hypothetical protein Y1Q_0003055 [Alligator mississippiensis]|uniref:Uncharacterized protein n=1 Tax=Alligator mississippiensis TaxID=8496 RepID=A0A151MDC1_ALLMI|nr:hypothetical protein Y1Q_0003055 [Alligator mississippiensis]